MQDINVDGRKIFYIDNKLQKEAPLLLFVHGAGGAHDVWEKQINYFTSYARIIVIDLPAHGYSQGPSFNSIEEYADFLNNFLISINVLTSLTLIGHSMGGAICQVFAGKYPEKVSQLILVGTGITLPVNETVLRELKEGIFNPKLNMWAFSKKTSPELVQKNEEKWRAVDAEVLYKAFNACNNFNGTGILQNLKVPVAVIFGKDDKLTPLTNIDIFKKENDKISEFVISDAGNMFMIEQPDAFNKVLSELIL